MWKVNPDGQFSFSDATNPDQPVLFRLDHAPSLLSSISTQFNGRIDVPVQEIKRWVINTTAFLDNHMRGALTLGEQNGIVIVNPIKKDGRKRRKSSFPDDVLVSFPTK